MKNFLFSAFTILIGAVSILSCSRTESNSIMQVTKTADINYTIEDVKNLQDFLLTKPTKDLSEKNYDLDGDNAWTVFDLCLMKKQINYWGNIQDNENNEQENILVAYFSRTGNTEKIAEKIVDITGADVFEIEAKIPYTDEDIAYNNSSCRANQEQNNKAVRPEISGKIENIEQYDYVFLGYPIWWGEEPRIIDTFLESYDFSDKTVIPFCTSGSSGIGTSEKNISELVTIGEQINGKCFEVDSTENEISDWIDSLEIDNKKEMQKMNISVNGHVLKAELADTQAANELYELIKNKPLTLTLNEYGNFEKVGKLPQSLTKSDEQITAQTGDIMLYQGNQMTIFYGENSWNYTRLGKIENVTEKELSEIFGDGDVTVTISAEREFDFETKTVMLNSGYEMPIMGLGTYSLTDEECYNSVMALLENGGRLIDTAYMYGNEAAVGRAIRDSDVPREEIFVITKIYPGEQFSNPEKAIQDALDKLDIGYIDMMLLHHPGENDVKAYLAMEKFVEDGKIHSLGLSNWYIEELKEFLPQINITPALVQNEIHPYYQEPEVVPYIQSLGIVVQGWYPFGGRGHTSELLGDETLNKIAEAHGVSAAQVILRWNLQRGVIVIPGSSNPDHIKENLDIFGFELSESEMEQIAKLNRDEKHDWY